MKFCMITVIIFLILPVWIYCGCPLGDYYDVNQKYPSCKLCPAGYYCPDGIKKEECPIGTYSTGGYIDFRNGFYKCWPCGLDNFNYECPKKGTSKPTKCKPGYSSFLNLGAFESASGNQQGVSQCVKCPCGTSPFLLGLGINIDAAYCLSCGSSYDCSDPAVPTKCPTQNVCFGPFFCYPKPSCQVLASDKQVIARTILRESSKGVKNGYEAVACVIYNRMNNPLYPKTAKDVTLQPKQFEPWKNIAWSGNTALKSCLPEDQVIKDFSDPAYKDGVDKCNELAEKLANNQQPTNCDFIKGAVCFFKATSNAISKHPDGINIGGNWFWNGVCDVSS